MSKTFSETSYVDFIARELNFRRQSNSLYSSRAFARDLGVSPSFLSSVLNSKVGLSVTTGKKIVNKLNLSAFEKTAFLKLIALNHHRSLSVRKISEIEIGKIRTKLRFITAPKRFSTEVVDWHYSALLALVDHHQFCADKNWIAGQLSITSAEAYHSWQHLIELELVQMNEDGVWQRNGLNILNHFERRAEHFHPHYRQVLKKAEHSLGSDSATVREFSTTFVSLNSEDYGFIQKEIAAFQLRLVESIAQRGGISDRVYCLAIQTFPVTTLPSEKTK